jgi:tetratricopeptide (TPR) repeat protein
MKCKKILLFFAAAFVAVTIVAGPLLAGSAEDDPGVKAAFERGWALEGLMHKDLKNLDHAAAIYRDVLARYPESPDALWRLSEIIFKKAEASKDKKQKKELCNQSLGYAEKAMAINPKMAEPHYWVAVNCALLADVGGQALKAFSLVNRAKKELARTIALDPRSRFATLSKTVLANIYLESPWPLRDLAKAQDLAKQAVNEDPNLTFASLILGKTYLKVGKKDLARKELSRCLDTAKPTYVWDAILYNWPEAKSAMKELD